MVPTMRAINSLPLHNCTDGFSSPFRQSRVVRFPCELEENMAMYHYTKSTRSQSLTVVERTISDLEPKSASFYTCNTVVLYTRLIWARLPMPLQAH